MLSLFSCEKEPETFEDCILQNLKNTHSNHAASLLHSVCRKKFPEQQKTDLSTPNFDEITRERAIKRRDIFDEIAEERAREESLKKTDLSTP